MLAMTVVHAAVDGICLPFARGAYIVFGVDNSHRMWYSIGTEPPKNCGGLRRKQ